MPLPKKTEYTLEDIYALPDGQRAELISGQLYMMAPPSTRHQRLVNFLTTEINLYIRKKQGKCEVLPAPLPSTVFVTVVCWRCSSSMA